MSGYDMIVTVALGSLVATIPLTTSVSLVDAIAAAAVFLGLQEVTRYLQSQHRRIHVLVREKPHLLLWNGEMLQDRLLDSDISEDEVRAAIRRSGLLSLSQVQAAVFENDGEWSIIPQSDSPDQSAMQGLDIPDGKPGKAASKQASKQASKPQRTQPTPQNTV